LHQSPAEFGVLQPQVALDDFNRRKKPQDCEIAARQFGVRVHCLRTGARDSRYSCGHCRSCNCSGLQKGTTVAVHVVGHDSAFPLFCWLSFARSCTAGDMTQLLGEIFLKNRAGRVLLRLRKFAQHQTVTADYRFADCDSTSHDASL